LNTLVVGGTSLAWVGVPFYGVLASVEEREREQNYPSQIVET